MPQQPDGPAFLCVGAAHWDFIGRASLPLELGDDIPGRIERRVGGVAANVAIGLSRLGCRASLGAAIGSDTAGQELLRSLNQASISCDLVASVPGTPTDRYLAIENQAGELVAAVADSACCDQASGQVVDRVILALDRFQFIFLDANLGTEAVAKIAEGAHAKGIGILVNPVSVAKAPSLKQVLQVVPKVTIVANMAEAIALTGCNADAASGARALVEAGAQSALVTDGPRAAALTTPSQLIVMHVPEPASCHSVTGAGDAVIAGYLSSLVNDEMPEVRLRIAMETAAKHMAGGSNT